MLTAVNNGRLTLPQLVSLMAERAAILFQLPGKGRIDDGFDADLVLIDLQAGWTFDPASCFSNARGTMKVYDGWPMQGRVVSTFVRGTRVFHQGEILTAPGFGRLVRPPFQTDMPAHTGANV